MAFQCLGSMFKWDEGFFSSFFSKARDVSEIEAKTISFFSHGAI